MRRVSISLFFAISAFALAGVTRSAHAQSKSASPGWGSDWLEPANEQQRQEREFVRQVESAQKARDFRAEITLCNRMIQKEPSSAGPYAIRANAHRLLKRYDLALADIDHAQEITRGKHLQAATAELFILRASLHESKKDYAAAINDLQESIKLNEKNAVAYNNLAWLRATAPDDALRNGRESVRLAQKAVALDRKKSFRTIDTLAAAYAEANNYAQAVACEKRVADAVAKEPTKEDEEHDLQKEVAERLRLYEQHQPYHRGKL